MACITKIPNDLNKRWPLLVLCLGVVPVQVDTSLVNLATHVIGEHLHVSLSILQWTVDGYNLSYAVLLMTGGTLGVAALEAIFAVNASLADGFTWAMAAGCAVVWLGAFLAFAFIRERAYIKGEKYEKF